MIWRSLFFLLLSSSAFAVTTSPPSTNPLKLPTWSDLDKYQSKAVQNISFRTNNYITFLGLDYGFKNGLGVNGTFCKKLSRYLCGGGSVFLGSLNSASIIRSPTSTETSSNTTELNSILNHPSHFFTFIPEIGLTVTTQIIPLAEGLWSESAWFGFGKAFIGGRSGWAISFEPGVNKKFIANGNFGWSVRAKYSFGWLNPKETLGGTIPFDSFNLMAGMIYTW